MPTLVINDVREVIDINEVKQCLVSSCTECCMTYLPNGEYNVKGAIHRAMMTVENVYGNYRDTRLDCSNCPVHLNTSPEEWARILSDMDGTA